MRKANNIKKVNTTKKSKSMKVAAVALALTLVTSCFAGGTFARYTAADNGGDSARVAQFGVAVTANGQSFAEEYNNELVVSNNGNKIVAPGTKGTVTAMEITGEPEVAVHVDYTADLKLANWEIDDEFYCPIEITVDGDIIKGTAFDTAEEFEKAVEDAIHADSADYEANADMAEAKAPVVTWAWSIEGNDNIKDTELSNQAAAGNAADIQLDITTTVTQNN
ncbi:MAG: hypothetical protein NC213_03380 [Acetobacter sp.]|nr:hypothetical protein [Bacteroides sp.]MCM1340765.1 hypothetical protein [Acetobacter sp.]MCM1432678.1 hypothetical protein [Clostridiales bacterium]